MSTPILKQGVAYKWGVACWEGAEGLQGRGRRTGGSAAAAGGGGGGSVDQGRGLGGRHHVPHRARGRGWGWRGGLSGKGITLGTRGTHSGTGTRGPRPAPRVHQGSPLCGRALSFGYGPPLDNVSRCLGLTPLPSRPPPRWHYGGAPWEGAPPPAPGLRLPGGRRRGGGGRASPSGGPRRPRGSPRAGALTPQHPPHIPKG